MMNKADSVTLYKIRKVISELSDKHGRGTELISLYIPPRKPIHEVIANLREEWGTAGNIKSDTTRNHVQDALVKTMQRLKLYRETPPNGLIIYAGALPTNGPGSEVVRIHEISPPKPVTTYLYKCLSPETNILLEDGSQKTIEELKTCWANNSVMSYDGGSHKLVRSEIRDYLKIPVGGRNTFRLMIESGREIVATEDHPFYTPNGWVRLRDLKPGDLLCVLPIPYPSKVINTSSATDRVIFSEEVLLRLPFPPKNSRLAIRRLRERGLLPLTEQNPKLPVLAHLLGHIFSDGSLVHTIEERASGPYSYFTVDLCVGSLVDEAELREDVAKLGYELPKGAETTYATQFDGRTYTAHTRHVKLRDQAICTLLRALGAPVGEKVKNGTEIPDWLTEGPLSVKREFLAAYLGGDGTAPTISGRNLRSEMGIGFHRIAEKKEGGLKFAHQLSQLFVNFGVSVNAIKCSPGYKRKDGSETVEIRLRFKLSEDNILKVCHDIGFGYCSRKMLEANFVGEYLMVKSLLRREIQEKVVRAQEMRSRGIQLKQIGELLAVAQTTVGQWGRGLVKNPEVPTSRLPKFSEWLRIARSNLAEPLLWESVISIELAEIPEVRDLTLDHGSHSFFANGFLVHNCDDHFHLEILKDMLRDEKIYGILVIDSTEAGLGILRGDRIDIEDIMTSGVSGKTRKGGQSARRYERARDMELTYFYNRVTEHATRVFLESNKVTGLIVGGPGPTKEDFLKGEYLDYRLRKNIIAVLDLSYSGREGIREILEKASDKLQDVRLIEEKKLVQRFLSEVNKVGGLAVYGLPRIMEALDKSYAETVLISDDADVTKLTLKCKNCGTPKEQIVQNTKRMQTLQEMISKPCEKCKSTDYEIEEKDIVDILEEKAFRAGAKVEMISSKTEEGNMFKSFGGFGAFLRYRP
jgi:peptide chain release factor subunit 1